MPTYQYVCTECGHDFETVQSFSDDALSVCPVCGGRLRKVFNSVGIVFKGSGFYRNDSREKAPAGATADGKAGASEGTKDAKPAGKTDAATTKPAKSGDSSSSSSSGGGSSTAGGSSTKGSAA